MTYCFYAVMGGFIVDVSSIHDCLTYVTIRPSGVGFLASRGHLLEIDKKTIKDKSKADLLAKTLACLQILWMVIQFVGRKAVGYPVSLLEIHVLVHVACAFCLYALWIKVEVSLAVYNCPVY